MGINTAVRDVIAGVALLDSIWEGQWWSDEMGAKKSEVSLTCWVTGDLQCFVERIFKITHEQTMQTD